MKLKKNREKNNNKDNTSDNTNSKEELYIEPDEKFDEEANTSPEYKKSQKQKGAYSPYKTGGGARTRKK